MESTSPADSQADSVSGKSAQGDTEVRGSGPVAAPGGGAAPAGGGGAGHAVFDLGGPVLQQVQVQLIFWGATWAAGSAALAGQVRGAVESILTGPYLTELAQYRGVGPGVLHGMTIVTTSNPVNGFNTDPGGPVERLVAQLLNAGTIPPASANPSMVYCVVMPPGIMADAFFTQRGLLGEHAFFVHNGHRVHFAWITARVPAPMPVLDEYSWIFSHEIAEACTDPEGTGIQLDHPDPSTWTEISDVCENLFVQVNGVLVQKYWSRAHNACIAPQTSKMPRWTSMGGQVKGGMAVTNDQTGRLQLFVQGMDNRVFRRFQTTPNGGWNSNFEPMDGQISGRIVGLRNIDGRLALFARDLGGGLVHAFQKTVNQDDWSGWSSLDPAGASVLIDDLFAGAVDHDGHLALFARRADGVVLHRSQRQPGGDWSAWAALDQGVRIVGAPVAARNRDGRLEVFGRDTQGAVHHIVQTSPGGPWGTWASLGGNVRNLLAVGVNRDGRLEVFIQEQDQSVHHRWQLHAGDSQHWNPNWESLGGKVNDVICVTANKDGRLEVFARGDLNALYHVWQQPQGGWANQWSSLGGSVSDLLAVGVNADGRLEAFVRSEHLDVQHIWQVHAGDTWIM